jgi:shikimate kinase
MIKLKKSLALVGLRGSGKSTLAFELSKVLNVPVIEMDVELSNDKGMSIPEWIKAEGWGSFREAEAQFLKKVSKRKSPCILSPGGGIITREQSIKFLQNSFLTIYLHWSPTVLCERIATDANRPRLGTTKTASEEVKLMYKERNDVYLSCGHTLKLKKGTKINKTISKVLDIVYRSEF